MAQKLPKKLEDSKSPKGGKQPEPPKQEPVNPKSVQAIIAAAKAKRAAGGGNEDLEKPLLQR